MPFSFPDDLVEDDNGLTVDGAIQIDAFNNIARFGPQDPLSVLVNATDVFSVPVFLASSAIAGYTLQVNATADGLEWGPGGGGGGGGESWSATLAIGHTSGANNAHIDTGQILSFGVEGSLPPSGSIRSSTDIQIRAVGGFEAVSTTTMAMQTIGNIPFKVITNGVERLEIQGDGAWQFQGDTGTAGQLLKSAGATSTPVWTTFALSDLPAIAAKSVLANATNASAVPAALAGSAAFQHLRVNSANTGLEWAVLTVSAPITITSNTIGFDSTANLDNNARVGVRKNSAGSTFLRRRLNLIEGSGVTLTVADDSGSEEVDVTITGTAVGLSPIADQRVLGNDSGASANPTAITVHQELDWIAPEALWQFDGVDDRVDFGDVNDIERTDSITVSAWIKTPSTAAAQAIISKIGGGPAFQGYEFGIEAPGKFYFLLVSNIVGANALNAQTVTGSVPVGALTHVAAVYTGTSLATGVTFYINGVVASQISPPTPGPITTTTLTAQNLSVGRSTSGSSPFLGEIHHVAKFTSALTAPQILEVYNLGTPPDLNTLPTAPAPVWWSKMDALDGIGASGILDYGSGSNEGTVGGGLVPGSVVGSVIARSTTLWQTISPAASGLALCSNGAGLIPSYRQVGLNGFPSMAAGTFLANITAGSAVPTAHTLSTFADAGLTYTNVTGLLAVGASTSIIVGANDVQRAALTGAITSAQNSNATAFGALAAKSVLANATNASAVPAALAGSVAFQHLRVNSANNALEWAVLTVTSPTTLTSDNIGFDQTVALGNNARIAVSKNSGATVGTRRRVNLIEGTGVTLTIADDAANEEVDVTIAAAAVTAGTVTPTSLSIFGTPTSTGVPFIIYFTFAAGGGGAADDVTVFSANAPFNFRILECWLVTTTAVGGSTVQARTATAGGGTALSTAMSSTATGKTSDNSTATPTVAASGSLILRRSDSGVSGEFFCMAIRV